MRSDYVRVGQERRVFHRSRERSRLHRSNGCYSNNIMAETPVWSQALFSRVVWNHRAFVHVDQAELPRCCIGTCASLLHADWLKCISLRSHALTPRRAIRQLHVWRRTPRFIWPNLCRNSSLGWTREDEPQGQQYSPQDRARFLCSFNCHRLDQSCLVRPCAPSGRDMAFPSRHRIRHFEKDAHVRRL